GNEENFIILVEYGSLSLCKQNFKVSITQLTADDQVMLQTIHKSNPSKVGYVDRLLAILGFLLLGCFLGQSAGTNVLSVKSAMLSVRLSREIRLFKVLACAAPISLERGGIGSRVLHSDSKSEVILGIDIDEDSPALVKITSFKEILSFLLPLPPKALTMFLGIVSTLFVLPVLPEFVPSGGGIGGTVPDMIGF
nr:hypothetical protein [Tanacetum cinerariifolium]